MSKYRQFISSQSFQRTKKSIYEYRWLIYVYICGWLIFLWMFVWSDKCETPWLDEQFGNGFSENFAASFFWDLIAFLFLGFLATLISTALSKKNPEDYTFHERIAALANNEKIRRDKSLMKFLTSHISTLLVYTRTGSLEITVTDFEISVNAFRLYVKQDQIITNMCKDNEYIHKGFKTSIFSDYEVPNKPNYITHDYLYRITDNKIIDENVNGHRDFSIDYDETMLAKIPKNDEIGYRNWYSIWNKCCGDIDKKEEWFAIFARRYTCEYKIVFKNELPSGRDFYIHTKVTNSGFSNNEQADRELRKNVLVNKNKPVTIKLKGELLPLEQIQVYFSDVKVN